MTTNTLSAYKKSRFSIIFKNKFMKIKTGTTIQTVFLFILSCLFSLVTHGQTTEKTLNKIYLQIATGPSTQNGAFVELGVQAVLKNNWVTTFSYHNIDMNPKGLPADYKPGYTLLIVFPIPDEYPAINLNLFSFTGGKCWEAGRKIWFTTEAGFSIVTGEKMIFTPQAEISDGYHVSANYSVKKEATTTIGGMLKADFNWAFLSFLGVGAGVFANFNSIQTPVGGQIKLIVGWMNLKSKKS